MIAAGKLLPGCFYAIIALLMEYKEKEFMSERLTAVLRDKSICAYDLLDENDQYIEDVRSMLRAASQSGDLLCPDCGSRLVLCAGAVREPYFRHFTLEECTATVAMRTKAGKRRYRCRKLLYELARRNGCSNLTLEENVQSPLQPVLFEMGDERVGYVFLDGRTRNYRELMEAAWEYGKRGIKLLFFLAYKYMSDGKNITSDEAEIARLNKGIIYYIDEEQAHITMRRSYEDADRIRRYFTEEYEAAGLLVDDSGDISGYFMQQYEAHVRRELHKFTEVLRFPIEDGIDEVYADMDYVCMDSLEEIWVLPEFAHEIEGAEDARKNRMAYAEGQNEALLYIEEQERSREAFTLAKEIASHRNSWDWQ